MKLELTYAIFLLKRLDSEISQDNTIVNFIPGAISLLEQQLEELK